MIRNGLKRVYKAFVSAVRTPWMKSLPFLEILLPKSALCSITPKTKDSILS